jgi:hypothetical protein
MPVRSGGHRQIVRSNLVHSAEFGPLGGAFV